MSFFHFDATLLLISLFIAVLPIHRVDVTHELAHSVSSCSCRTSPIPGCSLDESRVPKCTSSSPMTSSPAGVSLHPRTARSAELNGVTVTFRGHGRMESAGGETLTVRRGSGNGIESETASGESCVADDDLSWD